MLKISLDALQLLDAIERGGSLAAAAKEMYRVPSTVSYAVGKLEDELGVQIVERAGVWRSGEQGAALKWWRQRLKTLPLMERLSTQLERR